MPLIAKFKMDCVYMDVIDFEKRKKNKPPAKNVLNKKQRRPYCFNNGSYATHSYEIDFEAQQIICDGCKLKFSPWAVLKDLCNEESAWQERYLEIKKAEAKLAKRSRVKCQKCKSMVTIEV